MILVIDNYDSFTFNLVQMLAVEEIDYRVVRNDEADAEALLETAPSGVLLSPGPGTPEEARASRDLVALRPEVPLFGVCLGHQILAAEFGAEVSRAPSPVHGKTASVRHAGGPLFDGVPSPFQATRYHSLHVPEWSLTEELEATAWSEDGVLMGLCHRTLPYVGVQFHPESILTPEGGRIVANFVRLCVNRRRQD